MSLTLLSVFEMLVVCAHTRVQVGLEETFVRPVLPFHLYMVLGIKLRLPACAVSVYSLSLLANLRC